MPPCDASAPRDVDDILLLHIFGAAARPDENAAVPNFDPWFDRFRVDRLVDVGVRYKCGGGYRMFARLVRQTASQFGADARVRHRAGVCGCSSCSGRAHQVCRAKATHRGQLSLTRRGKPSRARRLCSTSDTRGCLGVRIEDPFPQARALHTLPPALWDGECAGGVVFHGLRSARLRRDSLHPWLKPLTSVGGRAPFGRENRAWRVEGRTLGGRWGLVVVF